MLKNSSIEGMQVPDVKFHLWQNGRFKAVDTQALFAGKTIIVFAVPGAFAPLYSSVQLLGYQQYAEVFKENGVDDIFCISVNDALVMNEWMLVEGINNIKVIPDGNGEFSREIGMLVDKHELGMGERSKRYSMLVRNGVVQKMFVEPNSSQDTLLISDAKTMLNHINPVGQASKQTSVLIQIWMTLLASCYDASGSLNY
jgi:glutathione-dependent peroxiredoxin